MVKIFILVVVTECRERASVRLLESIRHDLTLKTPAYPFKKLAPKAEISLFLPAICRLIGRSRSLVGRQLVYNSPAFPLRILDFS